MKMRSRMIGSAILALGLVLASATMLFAEPVTNYMAVKAGLFEPQRDIKSFDAGFTGELAFGHRFHRIVAGELGLGYLRATSGGTKFDAFPLTVSAKAILPLGNVEPYALAGAGLYFARLSGPGGAEDDATAGAHAGGGVQYTMKSITDITGFVGLEARYLWTKPSVWGVDVDVRGLQLTANFGVGF